MKRNARDVEPLKLTINWEKTPNGNYQTVTVDPRNGKTYYGAPVPLAFALRMGMKQVTR
jgi:uncharacterized protein (DUF2147 family)